jgi:hypothetical protein
LQDSDLCAGISKKDQVLPCDQSGCGEPYFQLTLHTVTVNTDIHDVIMEWVVTDKSANGCPRVNLWDGHLQDPHGNQIPADSYGDSGGNFEVDSNQSVTRDKIYKVLPQLDTPYSFYMQMPTGCNPIFGGDQNGYTYTFTFTNT